MFTYAHVKWFYGQSERAYYLNYFIKNIVARKKLEGEISFALRISLVLIA